MFDHVAMSDLVCDYWSVKDYIHSALASQAFVDEHKGELFTEVNKELGIYRRFYIDMEDLGLPGAQGRVYENTLDNWKKGPGLSELTVENVEATALSNDENSRGVDFIPLPDMMAQMTGISIDDEEAVVYPYVLTSSKREYGANAMFMPGVEETLNEHFPDGYVILPSSIHEVLVLNKPETMEELQSLNEMVRTINQAEVDPRDRLCDHVLMLKDGKLLQAWQEMAKEKVQEAKNVQSRRNSGRNM